MYDKYQFEPIRLEKEQDIQTHFFKYSKTYDIRLGIFYITAWGPQAKLAISNSKVYSNALDELVKKYRFTIENALSGAYRMAYTSAYVLLCWKPPLPCVHIVSEEVAKLPKKKLEQVLITIENASLVYNDMKDGLYVVGDNVTSIAAFKGVENETGYVPVPEQYTAIGINTAIYEQKKETDISAEKTDISTENKSSTLLLFDKEVIERKTSIVNVNKEEIVQIVKQQISNAEKILGTFPPPENFYKYYFVYCMLNTQESNFNTVYEKAKENIPIKYEYQKKMLKKIYEQLQKR